jgi:hypothetical protein
MATRSLLPVHSTILAEGRATALAVLATSLLAPPATAQTSEVYRDGWSLKSWYRLRSSLRIAATTPFSFEGPGSRGANGTELDSPSCVAPD